ncbi:hypothetical protein HYW76_00280 [Candidatus Pacearchaeota archaeon]|nr:hypothetical protein [Candidatus Pacearchaeota archaeon]
MTKDRLIQLLQERNKYWDNRKKQFPSKYGFPNGLTRGGYHFNHIVGNTKACISIVKESSKEKIRNKALMEDFLLAIYFDLLENFPEFRNGEFTPFVQGDGFFQDIRDTGSDGSDNYIFESAKRLMGMTDLPTLQEIMLSS